MQVKQHYRDVILFFKVGSFYEVGVLKAPADLVFCTTMRGPSKLAVHHPSLLLCSFTKKMLKSDKMCWAGSSH